MKSLECHSKEIPCSQGRERERLLDVAAASQPGGAGEVEGWDEEACSTSATCDRSRKLAPPGWSQALNAQLLLMSNLLFYFRTFYFGQKFRCPTGCGEQWSGARHSTYGRPLSNPLETDMAMRSYFKPMPTNAIF